MPFNYDGIPAELRARAQWCVAGVDDVTGKYRVPNKISAKGALLKADPTNPTSWRDFEAVRSYADAHPPHGIGYVLSADDPFVCIDLDIKNANNEPDVNKWTTQEEIERYQKIIMSFHSYTERSSGGQGYHIWLRGSVGKGLRRGGVEVYSQERFIVSTGDVILNVPIAQNDEMLTMLCTEISRIAVPVLTLVETAPTEPDEVIFARAVQADNASKFIGLCEGKWSDLGYPSQSEADAALMTMLAFYSKSNSQCIRMFRSTNLGIRDKAVRNDTYLNTTLRKVRSIAAKEEVVDSVGENMARAIAAQVTRTLAPVPPAPQTAPPAAQPAAPIPTPQPQLQTAPASAQQGNIFSILGGAFQADQYNWNEPSDSMLPPIPKGGIDWPPGLAGRIARYIFATSPRPVKEVGIVASLGLLAGMFGKAYHIPQSGLNLYIVLVAQSAVGKEAMHSGISNIIYKTSSAAPGSSRFVDFNDYASGPALTKAVIANPCFVNVSGEWGKKLARISRDDLGDGPMQQLRSMMTNLYQKSGPGSVFGGIGYSDKEKSVASISGVAYSMIGETTPDTFYDALTDSMMADGFLSRFTVVEYTGDRPAMNPNFSLDPDPALMDAIAELMLHAQEILIKNTSQIVISDPEATKMLHELDLKCDQEINSTKNEGWRQMWNRAHLKILRIAALLSIPENNKIPMIRAEHVKWAYDLVMRDITVMTRRIESGDVGTGDSTRENKILSLCKTYLSSSVAPSYGIPDQMRVDGVIPRKYLQIGTQKVSCFTNHRLGQTASLDMTLRSLVEGGYLMEMDKTKAVQNYMFHGKCYRVVNLPMSSSEAAAVQLNQQVNRK